MLLFCLIHVALVIMFRNGSAIASQNNTISAGIVSFVVEIFLRGEKEMTNVSVLGEALLIKESVLDEVFLLDFL